MTCRCSTPALNDDSNEGSREQRPKCAAAPTLEYPDKALVLIQHFLTSTTVASLKASAPYSDNPPWNILARRLCSSSSASTSGMACPLPRAMRVTREACTPAGCHF